MPLVSVIIPVYNTEKYLVQCLNSVVNQTYPYLEIIIINDASTDYSLTILKEFEKEYKNIKIINNPINLGVSISRNIGLDAANGDYIFFLDSDDFIKENAIDKMVYLTSIHEVPLVEAKFKSVVTSHIPKTRINPSNQLENLEKNQKSILNRGGCVWNKLYAHDLIGNLKFPENLSYEDNAFIYPLLTKAKQVIITNEITYFYRRHFNNSTIQNKLKPNSKILDIYSILKIIRQRCIELGTYEEYSNTIEMIIENKAFIPLLQSSTWLQMTPEDKKQVLNNLYQYSKNQFHMPQINEISLNSSGKLFEFRKQLLLKYINEDAYNSLYANSLEPAKRIISHYKK